jgi:hypothetical protein
VIDVGRTCGVQLHGRALNPTTTKEHDMTDFSGTFTAKTESQTTVNGPGNHQLGLAVTCGPQTTADANWKGAMVTQWATSDTVDGHGKIHGYFRNVHPNGDTDY